MEWKMGYSRMWGNEGIGTGTKPGGIQNSCDVKERMAYVKLEGFRFVQKKDYLPIKREID